MGEDRIQIGAGHSFVEPVEQRIAGVDIGFKESEILLFQFEQLLKMRSENPERLFLPCAFPCGVGAGTGLGVAADPGGGGPAFPFEVPADLFNQAALIRIGIQGGTAGRQTVDPMSQFRRNGPGVCDLFERGELKGAGFDGSGRHIRSHIPVQQSGRGLEVGNDSELVFQLFQIMFKVHASTPIDRC